MRKIKSNQVSIIIQGALQAGTQEVIDSARNNFPDAEIILSSWVGSTVNITGYDTLVLTEDPGDPAPPNYLATNLARQTISSREGLLKATRPFAIKTRTDLRFTHGKIFDYFPKFPNREKKYALTKDRVIVSNITTFKPNQFFNIPFAICDFIYAGNTNDLLNIFSAPIQSDEELSWFLQKPAPKALDYFPGWIARFSPETWLTLNLVKKKFKVNISDSFSEPDSETQDLAKKIMLANFIVLNIKQLGVLSDKYSLPLPYFCFCYTHQDWLDIYQNQKSTFKIFKDPESIQQAFKFLRLLVKLFVKNIFSFR